MNSEIYSESENSRNKYAKGFYVVLALCVCAIGLAGWYTYADVQSYMNGNNNNKSPEIAITSSEPVNKQAEVKIGGVGKEQPTEPPTVRIENKEQDSPQRLSPTGKNTEVLQGFSKDRLVYFETLKDWRLHKGTDYAVSKGETVYSVANGKVTDIGEDDLYGEFIEMEYRDGFICRYYGVEKSENIAVGKSVQVGDGIGTVTEVPCESSSSSHIHIEITKDGQIVNPQSYIQLQK